MNTYCNPLSLPYPYQHYGRGGHREAADPSVVLYGDRYLMFASMCGGFFWSEDLRAWQFQPVPELPPYPDAPCARVIGGRLAVCASSRGKPAAVYMAEDPFAPGGFTKAYELFELWDPALFEDADGRVYLYWSDNGSAILGVELDAETFAPLGERRELIAADPKDHGWERRSYPGQPEEEAALAAELGRLKMRGAPRGPKEAPCLGCPRMDLRNGRYYLEYAAPAAEMTACGDGVYVGEGPLGQFSYAEHNPVSFRPAGFVTGTGGGCTFADKDGRLWHAASVRVAVNAPYERRIGLFPAALDKDGALWCDQRFADWPQSFDRDGKDPRWMLLSYRAEAAVSGSMPGHGPELAADEDIRTFWRADRGEGAWLRLDLGAARTVCAVQINLADAGVPAVRAPLSVRSDAPTGRRWIDTDPLRRTRWLLEGSEDGERWHTLADRLAADTDLAHEYIELPAPERLRYLRLTAGRLPYNQNFAVSGLRVFGLGGGDKPERVRIFSAKDAGDTAVGLHWDPAKGAQGYCVRYGAAPDKLYSSVLVYGETSVTLRSLARGQRCYAAVDAFNENGVTEGAVRVYRKWD